LIHDYPNIDQTDNWCGTVKVYQRRVQSFNWNDNDVMIESGEAINLPCASSAMKFSTVALLATVSYAVTIGAAGNEVSLLTEFLL
jgi:hypothetical protein